MGALEKKTEKEAAAKGTSGDASHGSLESLDARDLARVRWLLAAAHAAPSADNTQPWRCVYGEGAFRILHDGARLASPMAGPETHMSRLSLGTMLENIHQGAAAVGVSLSAADTLDGPEASRALKVTGIDNSGPENVDHPLLHRHTNRHPYRRTALPSELLVEVGAMTEGTARVLVREGRRDRRFLAEQVRLASIARFRTQELHEWLMGSLRWTPAQVATGEGLDVRTLHLPPGGRWLLRFLTPWRRMKWFGALGGHRAMARTEAGAFQSAGAALAIVAKRDDVVAAGRLLQRVWIRLNERGVAVHPFYVVTDQHERLSLGRVPESCVPLVERSRDACRDKLSLREGEGVQMLLRIGQPKKTPVRSQRLPRE